MAKRTSKVTSKDSSRRAKPSVPKAGVTKHKSRYACGGKLK